jgi:putative acetyltransferase
MLFIRRAESDDHGALLELWERSVRATHHFLSGADVNDLLPLVADELSDSKTSWWVAAIEHGPIAGFLGYVPGSIEGLFVDPEFRGRGVGSLLIEHAQHLSGGGLRVDVNEQNPEALGFYQSRGFSIVGRSEVDDGGRPFPVLHMARWPGRGPGV